MSTLPMKRGNQSFNTGLFTQAPQQRPRFTPPSFGGRGGGPFGATAGAVMDASTQFRQQNAFDPLTQVVQKKRRVGALETARAEGLTPESGSKYYARVRDLLLESGDAEGAEIAEQRRVAEENRSVAIESAKAGTAKTKTDTKRTQGIIDNNIDERTVETAEQRANTDAKRAELAEEQLQFNYDKLDTEIEMHSETLANNIDVARIKARADVQAKLAAAGIPDDIKDIDVKVAKRAFQAHLNKALSSKDGKSIKTSDIKNTNFMQLWTEHALGDPNLGEGNLDLKSVLTEAVKGSAEEKARAALILDSIAQNIALNEKIIKSEFPSMPQKRRIELAIAAGPNPRVARDNNTGKRVLVTVDNEVIVDIE